MAKFPWKFIGKVLLHLESLSLCGRQPLGSHRYGTRGGERRRMFDVGHLG